MLQCDPQSGIPGTANEASVYPKAGKKEKRPLGVPCVADRALQRSVRCECQVAIYEQEFLPCSFGGRPRLSAHHALATLNEVISQSQTVGWVL